MSITPTLGGRGQTVRSPRLVDTVQQNIVSKTKNPLTLE